MKEAIIRAHGLTRIYGRHRALNGVDITVNRGDIYGLIGRNGAGKTTMLKIFTGLTIPDEGSYELFGKESEQERGRIGCLIDSPAFFGNEMPEGELTDVSRVFDEFWTTDVSRTKGSTGLGLAIVKQFSEMLSIGISADAEDGTFRIVLDLAGIRA